MDLTKNNVVAWHDRTPEEHHGLVKTWADQKFRTASLSLYGTPQDLRFAAVMVKRPVVTATKQLGPLDRDGIQEAFDEMAEQHWGPYIITATGPASSALFAAVFTPMQPVPLTRLVLTPERFAELNGEQQAAGKILVWADAFGTAGDTRYTAIWGPNPSRQAWNCDAADEGGAALQARYEAMKAMWCRPAHIAVTPSGRNLELFVDSTMGAWSSRVDMSGAEYQDVFEKAAAKGRLPIRVSASGPRASARFAAIFADRDDVDARVYRAKGPVTVNAIDAAMKTFVEGHNLRGAALAITQGTRLVYAKGYTFGEPAPIYRDVLPTTPFRQASVSKTFAAVAMWRLLQQRADITLDTTMQSVLKLKQLDGSAPKDDRYADITIRHLLESNSGMKQGLLYHGTEAAAAAGKPLPATPSQLARYGAGWDLTGDPGSSTNVVYGNFDNLMLSQVIAELAGASSFEQALKTLVLDPLKMVRTRGSRSLVGAQAADEARHHMRAYRPENSWPLFPLQLGTSVKAPAKPVVPYQYGQHDYELFDGCGGLSSAVVDVARLIAMFNDRSGNPVLNAASIDELFTAAAQASSTLSGPDAHGYHGFDSAAVVDAEDHSYRGGKGGWLPGLGTSHSFVTGGFGFVVAANGNGRVGGPKWLDLVGPAAKAHNWSDTDLFPSFGMPALTPRRLSPKASSSAVLAKLAATDHEDLVRRSISRGVRERLR